MNPLSIWLTMLGMGVITYLIRLSIIILLGRFEIPAGARRALRFVPPAVLAAIIFPEVLRPGGVWDLTPGNARLLAALAAAFVAWRTRNMLLTIAVGMGVLWALQAVMGFVG